MEDANIKARQNAETEIDTEAARWVVKSNSRLHKYRIQQKPNKFKLH